MNKVLIFKNLRCGELCAINTLEIKLPSRANFVPLIDQLGEQGWQIMQINGKNVSSICECGDPVFSKDSKYCTLCLRNKK
jgi:hypothetical protein